MGELLRYSVSESDNNACDILFRYIGGVEVVDKYIRTLGITDFKIEATEEDMHEGFRYQYLNWTTPLAAVRALEKFCTETLFRHSGYKEFLEKIMMETEYLYLLLIKVLISIIMLYLKKLIKKYLLLLKMKSQSLIGNKLINNNINFAKK